MKTEKLILNLGLVKWGAWLAQSVEDTPLDLRVVSLRATLDVEIT